MRYVLQDANYNVTTLLSVPPDAQTPPAVLAEYAYDPYGQPIYAHEPGLTQGTYNSVGHQGLFFYAFTNTGSPLAVGANGPPPGLYYNRNRWYSPKLGRFTSRDPNETAAPIAGALLMNAASAAVLFDAFSPTGHFGNGMNLYQYEGSNPLNRTDPLGLMSWDDELDSQMSDMVGQKLYALGMINEGAKYAAIGLRSAVNIAASFLPGSGLYEAFKSVQVIADGKGGFWDAMNIAMAAFPLAKGLHSLVGMGSLFKAGRYIERACNSFVAGTLVDTPGCQVPIELLQVGDEVTTRNERNPTGPPTVGKVTRVIRGWTVAFLWIALANGETLGATFGHDVWTYERGWVQAGELRAGETLQSLDGQPVQVLAIHLDRTPPTPPSPACEDAGIDGDGDVDNTDFGYWQRCYTGAFGAIDPSCVE